MFTAYRNIFRVFISTYILTQLIACSSRPTPVVVAGSSSGGDGSSTQSSSNTTNTSTSTGTTGVTVSYSPSPFDTTPGTTTGTTGSSNTSSINSTIFDNSMNLDPKPSTTVVNVPDPSQTYMSCLSSNNGLGSATGSAMGAGSLRGSCVDPSWGGHYDLDNLFDYGMGSFASMDTCYQYIMSQTAPYCTNDANAGVIFKRVQMGLVRCFRKILRQQMAFTQWMPEQQQAFNYTDNNLYMLLALILQGNN